MIDFTSCRMEELCCHSCLVIDFRFENFNFLLKNMKINGNFYIVSENLQLDAFGQREY